MTTPCTNCVATVCFSPRPTNVERSSSSPKRGSLISRHEDLIALEYADFVDALRRGIAGHHAGMVPAFREIVETCFEHNLLGVVFATETLALGINMPARSVALERFTKYSDAGRQFLTSAEYAQMTGRAGRRGLDDEGHAIVCFASDLSLQDVGRIALAPPADLHSSFRPTVQLHGQPDQPL